MKTRIRLTRVGYSRKELHRETRAQTESRRVKVKEWRALLGGGGVRSDVH